MTRITRSLLLVSALFSATPVLAEPGGCLKYGAVGAVAGHMANHGVLGAVGGCATGMYQRHRYRKSLKEKAALWDKEHPADASAHTGWWQSHNDAASVKQKSQWYDTEHPEPSDSGASKP